MFPMRISETTTNPFLKGKPRISTIMVPTLPHDPAPWGKARRHEAPFDDLGGGRIRNVKTGQVLVYDPFKRTWTSAAKRSPRESNPPIVLLPLTDAPETE